MTNYIQDVIWANQQTCTYHFHETSTTNRKHALPRVKFYRAETVEELLKQARDIVDCYNAEYNTCDDLITTIDKFLGEN